MTPLLSGLVLRSWVGLAHGPVTMHYDSTRTQTPTETTAVAWQAASAGTAPALGGGFAWRIRPGLEAGMTIGVTFDRFHAHFGAESTTETGHISRHLNEDYRNRTVPFGPQVLAILNEDGAVRPVLGGQLQLWIPSTLQEHGPVRDGYPTFWPPVFVVPGVTAGAEVELSAHTDLFVHGFGQVIAGGYEVGVSPEGYAAQPPALSRLGGGVQVGVQWRK